MELTLDQSPNGQMRELAELVAVESINGRQVRYRTAEPALINPQLVRRLASLGLGVVSLTPITQTLEEVYLRVVTDQLAQEETPRPLE